MFALEVHVLGTFHHVFALDSLSGCYLGIWLMPLAVCAWWLILILTFVFHGLISLCGLMDTYDWTIAYVSYSC